MGGRCEAASPTDSQHGKHEGKVKSGSMMDSLQLVCGKAVLRMRSEVCR